MPTVVVKLGSSIVAEDDGALRVDVLGRVCDEVAALHAAGDEVVIVTSGAIARGIGCSSLPVRPRRSRTCRRRARSGRASSTASTTSCCASAAHDRAGAAHVLRHERAHALPQRAPDAAQLLDWRVVPVINENDTTTTDEISFGDNDFLAAQVAVLIDADLLVLLTDTDGLYTADPRPDPTRGSSTRSTDFEALGTLEIGHANSPLGSGGMRSKVVAAEMATAAGIAAVIARARPDALGPRVDGRAATGRASRHRRAATRASSSG